VVVDAAQGKMTGQRKRKLRQREFNQDTGSELMNGRTPECIVRVFIEILAGII
jgi:hypothetical protein